MSKLVAFTTDCLQRLIANNPGGELSSHITSSLGVVEDCVTQDQGKLGIRKAAKMTKDHFRTDIIPAEGKHIEAGFIAAFGADSPILLEALPQGRNIFNTCSAASSIRHDHSTFNPRSKPRPRAGVRGL